jgi:hypothetical protein
MLGVRFGSNSKVDPGPVLFRFALRSGHRQASPACPKSAMNGRAQLVVPQLKTFYSIASSAVASSEGGTSRSSVLAVFKLTTRRKPIRQRLDCCELTERGHALPEPITNFMKSRRLIAVIPRCRRPERRQF